MDANRQVELAIDIDTVEQAIHKSKPGGNYEQALYALRDVLVEWLNIEMKESA